MRQGPKHSVLGTALAPLGPGLCVALLAAVLEHLWRAELHQYGAGERHLGAVLLRADAWRNARLVLVVGLPFALWIAWLLQRGRAARGARILMWLALAWTVPSMVLQPDWRVVRLRGGAELPNVLWRRDALLAAAGFAVLAALAASFVWWRGRGRQVPASAGPEGGARARPDLAARAFAALALAGLAGLETYASASHETRGNGFNVLYVTWDSTRADRLSCYGHERRTTPRVDALAEQSLFCARAYSQYDWTRPSYASVMTSLPLEAMATGALGPREFTLAELLTNEGYRARAVVQNPNLSAFFHQDQGFERYIEFHPDAPTLDVALRAERELAELAAGDRPFFLFVHIEQPHWPYRLEGPYAEEFVAADTAESPPISAEGIYALMRHNYADWDPDDPLVEERLAYMFDLYDADIREADEALGRILDRLHELDLEPRTVVAFNSDHGDEFFERGTFGHTTGNLHQELTRVPLLFRLPPSLGHAPRRIETAVQNLDLAPTVLGALGLAVPTWMRGRDLTQPEPAHPHVVFSSAAGRLAIREGSHGLFFALDEWDDPDRGSLYDLEADPAELTPLDRTEHAVQFATLRAAAELWRAEAARLRQRSEEHGRALPARAMDPDLERNLRDLGYAD